MAKGQVVTIDDIGSDDVAQESGPVAPVVKPKISKLPCAIHPRLRLSELGIPNARRFRVRSNNPADMLTPQYILASIQADAEAEYRRLAGASVVAADKLVVTALPD